MEPHERSPHHPMWFSYQSTMIDGVISKCFHFSIAEISAHTSLLPHHRPSTLGTLDVTSIVVLSHDVPKYALVSTHVNRTYLASMKLFPSLSHLESTVGAYV